MISNSWGLSVCSVKCPVCYDVLPKHVWSKYVTRDMLARYERFNQPYRSFSRFCNGCGFEVQPTPAPSLASDGLNQCVFFISVRLYDAINSSLPCTGPSFKSAKSSRRQS